MYLPSTYLPTYTTKHYTVQYNTMAMVSERAGELVNVWVNKRLSKWVG